MRINAFLKQIYDKMSEIVKNYTKVEIKYR